MYPELQIGPFVFQTHAVTNLITLLLLAAAVRPRSRRVVQPKSRSEEIDSVFYVFLGVIFGGWAAYTLPFAIMILSGQEFPSRWWAMGTHWMGFVAGGMTGGYFVARKYAWPFWKLADQYAPLLALALGIGRIGCLMAGDAHGKVTDSWIGMYLPDVFGTWAVRYPTQIVSIFVNLSLAVILFFAVSLCKRRATKTPSVRVGGCFDGAIFLLYVLLFCAQRFIFEFWRADNPALFGPFHWTHLYCVVGFVWAAVMVYYRRQATTQ